MSVLDRAYEAAKDRQARVVFPEWEDPRVAEARAKLTTAGLADPVPVSAPSHAPIAA